MSKAFLASLVVFSSSCSSSSLHAQTGQATHDAPVASTRTYYATTVSIPMRDGVELAGNLLTPGHGKPSPTIVSITPYGRHGGHGLAASFAKAGFSVLFADVRGKGDSGGTFNMFEADLTDSIDAVNWAASQPFSNGRVSMWGSSYGGFNQWAAALSGSTALVSITPGAAVYPGWDFPMTNYVGYPYAAIWPAHTQGRMTNRGLFADYLYWSEAFLEVLQKGVAFEDIDEFVGFDTDLFDEWARHPYQDAYWDNLNPTPEQLAAVDMPILSTTGLYDGAQRGTLRWYEEHLAVASEEARAQHYLVIGPYDHAGVVFPQTQVGGLVVPDAGGIQSTDLHAQWYHWTLEGGPKPEFLKDRVMYYVMGDGANNWRAAASLDELPSRPRRFYLHADKSTPDALSRAGNLEESVSSNATVSYSFDPTDISKASLGNWPIGNFALHDSDVKAIEGEALIFETAPFEQAAEIIGLPKFEALISINTPDTDFQIRIYEILPDGTSVYLSEARSRARHRESVRREVLLTTTDALPYVFDTFNFVSRQVQPGSRIRLVFGAPNSIYIQRNYQAAMPIRTQTPADALTSTVSVRLGGADGAVLTLPIQEISTDE